MSRWICTCVFRGPLSKPAAANTSQLMDNRKYHVAVHHPMSLKLQLQLQVDVQLQNEPIARCEGQHLLQAHNITASSVKATLQRSDLSSVSKRQCRGRSLLEKASQGASMSIYKNLNALAV